MTLPTYGHRFKLFTRAAFAVAVLLFALAVSPAVARAATPGTGGWYWPVGTESFRGWDGWWEYRPQSPPRWHMAQDMPCSVGHAVYAIGDGVVLESGGDHHYGGVIVVLHKTADGHYFKAVYGHMHPAACAGKGAKVKAGQVVGHVNGAAHLHFGIHPGKAYPPDRNPYRGHTYTSKNTYGWVDPIKYLRTNPRVIPYFSPPLPTIASVDTTERPTVLGVRSGRVFWTIGAQELLALYARSLDDTQTVAVDPADELGSLDSTRFPAIVGPASFTLSDRLPRLTLTASMIAPAWKHAVTVTGRLTSAAGAAFKGATITLESSRDGAGWVRIKSTITSLTGTYALSWVPTTRVRVRARFVPPRVYLPVASMATTLAPRPALSAPALPSAISDDASFRLTGTLTPRHATGTGAVSLQIQRLDAGVWTDYSVKAAVCRDVTGGSGYSASLRLPAGSWRVRARTPVDAAHSSGASAWKSFVLR